MAKAPTGGSPFDFQADPNAVEGVDYLDGYNTIRAFALLNGQLLDFDAVEKAFRNLLRCSNYFPCLHAGRVNGMRFSIDADGNVVVTDGTDDDTTYTLTPLDATLLALAATAWAANAIPIGTGTDTLSQTTFAANTFPARASTGNLVAKSITDFALTILDDADAATVRTTIGAGTGSGDVTAASNLTDNAIVRGDGGAKGVQTSSATIDDSGNIDAPNLRNTLHFPPGQQVAGAAAVTALVDGDTFFVYLGRAKAAITTLKIRCQVTTAFIDDAGPEDPWAEVGVFIGAPATGTVRLGRVGSTNVATTFNSTGVKDTAVALTGVAAGDHLWAAFSTGADGGGSTIYQIRGCVEDTIESGQYQDFTGQLSLMSAAPTTTVVTIVDPSVTPPWIAVYW